MGLASGSIILILEGGYNLTPISESMAACTCSLLGDPPPLLTLPRPQSLRPSKYWCSLWVMKVEDKEGPSSSKLVTKKAPQPAKHRLAEWTTTLEKKVLEAGMGKVISASSRKESTPGQTKSETAVLALSQEQSSEAATWGAMLTQTISEEAVRGATQNQTTSEDAVGGTMLGQTTSEEAVGGATLAQTTSKVATEGATLDQMTSEEALGGTELIRTPPASSTDHQTPPTSPMQGTTLQISPSTLTGSLRTLELGSESQGAPESQAPGENLLGEAARGQVMADSMPMQGSRGLADQAMFYAVTPLPWSQFVCPMPAAVLDVTQPCGDCGTILENWVCLSCYQVYCGHYINAHMLQHHGNSGHPLVLSYIDLLTWCYYCQACLPPGSPRCEEHRPLEQVGGGYAPPTLSPRICSLFTF
ncbi:LOW QUALITY PROTEIN: Histone deacetylase 6 [Plecturocebus cupreus]